jgi:DNA-binding CsgD family transcriptional regulator
MSVYPLTSKLPSEYLPGVEQLTDAEREVVDLMLAGLSQTDIAARIGSTRERVAAAAWRAYNKLGINSQRQLLCLVIEALMPVDEVTG